MDYFKLQHPHLVSGRVGRRSALCSRPETRRFEISLALSDLIVLIHSKDVQMAQVRAGREVPNTARADASLQTQYQASEQECGASNNSMTGVGERYDAPVSETFRALVRLIFMKFCYHQQQICERYDTSSGQNLVTAGAARQHEQFDSRQRIGESYETVSSRNMNLNR